MDFGKLLFRPLYWLAGRIFALWARPDVAPQDPGILFPAAGPPVCYVLESGGLADALALERICRLSNLTSPTESLSFSGISEPNRIVVMRRKRGFLFRRPRRRGSTRLQRLIEASLDADGRELLLVPVAIYWGRSPEKEEASWLKLIFAENWEFAGRTRKFFVTLFQGRNTLLQFSEPLSVRAVTRDDIEPEIAYRKISRILRVHFRQRRTATVGPDLSHRRNLVNAVVRHPAVQRAIHNESNNDAAALERRNAKAREYAREIAADISYTTVRVVERLLGWVWNRIYDGIDLSHVERLHDVATHKEIVYVPCHRSHFDYLLLSYIVYHQDLSLPHVAAGINLNIPVVGRILRRGGAFFLRRSFKGNRLYATVFTAYLHEILARGHSIEYFVEGGRSRTGRLLRPKGGMLAMTVQSYLRAPRRPIVFVPVYFGYEKLIEGDSFISELGGAAKRRESLTGLIRSISALRSNFGKVYVNIGEPIELEPVLDAHRSNWRAQDYDGDEKPEWITRVIDDIGGRIMQEINSAAAVTPISLLAMVLLSTPKQAMGMGELHRQIRLCLDLLERFRYSDSVTLPDISPGDIVRHGVSLRVIENTSHPLGDVRAYGSARCGADDLFPQQHSAPVRGAGIDRLLLYSWPAARAQ